MFSGPIQYHRILPWFFSTIETISEIMDMDWEAEWDGLGDNEPWVTETHLAGSTQKAVQDFRKWWNRYPPLTLFHARLLALYFEIQHGGIIQTLQTSADAFKLVQPEEIKMYLIFRIKSSPTSIRKQNIRQSTVYGYYKTLQMVYCLDARRRLEKPTNDMIHAVSKPCLKEFRCRNPTSLLFCPVHEYERVSQYAC